MVPERLAHYRVVERLGAGAMGEVYLAEDTKLGRSVAIKILPPVLAEDPERLDRFVREAKTASAINHPNVAHIYEIGTAGDLHFIAMERVEGETLGARAAAAKSIELSEILDWGIQMADALDEAHQRGIVHRDIKPGNVLITPRGQIKILDFGLAKMHRDEAVDLESSAPTEAKTTPGLVMGTVSYMSPEQAFGRDVDHRSDLFSLGVLLYELTSGRHPFKGETVTATIDGIAHTTPEPMARFRHGTVGELDELDRIVRKLLEKSPGNRYQSARELLVDLRNLKRDTESGGSVGVPRSRARGSRWSSVVAAAAGLVVVVALVSVNFMLPSDRIDSVAVLPFENDGADPDADYLSDGITGNIIVSLSHLPNVRVISRSAAFRYKDQRVDPEDLRTELDVDAVVLGRLTQRGNDLTLMAELVATDDGSVLWSEAYSRKLADVMALQEDLAREISLELTGRLTPEDETRLARRETESAEAFQAYLQGMHHLEKRTQDGFRLALEYFQRAIDEDPEYALAYSGKADALGLLGHYAYLPPAEAHRRARDAALKALEIDDELPEAHVSLGWIDYNTCRWNESEASFHRALELDPDYVTGLQFYSLLLSTVGRHDEALAAVRHAQSLDPLSPFFNMYVGAISVWAERIDEAIEAFQASLELDPTYVQSHRYLGQAYEKAGEIDEAMETYEKAIELSDGALGLGDLGHLYAVSGHEAKAREILRRLQDPSSRRHLAPVEMVRLYAGLGEEAKLHDWLEKADEQRAGEFLFLHRTPVGDTLKGDPKYEEILQRMGLGSN